VFADTIVTGTVDLVLGVLDSKRYVEIDIADFAAIALVQELAADALVVAVTHAPQ
jgi:hypothetical protein